MSPSLDTPELWTIVLAAGDGTRLLPLTRALHGEDLPKQFATIHESRSLLQATLARTRRLSPPRRTVAVVAAEREGLARRQLADLPGVDIVAQPKNLGTGPGILLPLCRVASRAPSALVAIVPSDHYVRDANVFNDALLRAAEIARRENTVVVIGAVPEGPETQYGWLVPHPEDAGSAKRVVGFVEKPAASAAADLFRRGALWSTFVMVGPAERLLELSRQHLPEQSALFDAYRNAIGTPGERAVLAGVYERLHPADFSRDVLERSTALRVVPLESCGWSDWGTPGRVLASLRGTEGFHALTERLRAARESSRDAGLVPAFLLTG